MRKLVITQNITLDGSIETLTDWFSPVADPGVDQSDLTAEMKRQDSECDAVVLGRQTFTDFQRVRKAGSSWEWSGAKIDHGAAPQRGIVQLLIRGLDLVGREHLERALDRSALREGQDRLGVLPR